jgi:hypothetical protein
MAGHPFCVSGFFIQHRSDSMSAPFMIAYGSCPANVLRTWLSPKPVGCAYADGFGTTCRRWLEIGLCRGRVGRSGLCCGPTVGASPLGERSRSPLLGIRIVYGSPISEPGSNGVDDVVGDIKCGTTSNHVKLLGKSKIVYTTMTLPGALRHTSTNPHTSHHQPAPNHKPLLSERKPGLKFRKRKVMPMRWLAAGRLEFRFDGRKG